MLKKFTQPKSCCLCINVRTGTLILAFIQLFMGLSEVVISTMDEISIAKHPEFYLGLVELLFGIYGMFSVYKVMIHLTSLPVLYLLVINWYIINILGYIGYE